MRRNTSKAALYESIMRKVSGVVKNALNEKKMTIKVTIDPEDIMPFKDIEEIYEYFQDKYFICNDDIEDLYKKVVKELYLYEVYSNEWQGEYFKILKVSSQKQAKNEISLWTSEPDDQDRQSDTDTFITKDKKFVCLYARDY